ncbi:DNA replication complex GINS protein PSF3-like [Sycon ciliatum]|uniref:DNA replication complex GINS protein PSF3-like n=1 Tax=Sycon ciliatum TaxID=27933 RepID=UPI0020ADBA02|eukprot:scpid71997/ scgid13639/ DNA replication complex GINS protein PSF3; GINS complex subunit 3
MDLLRGGDYFSIDDILSSQEKVPCVLDLPLIRLGYLDATSESEHIVRGSKLDFPIWLANALKNQRTPIVSVDLPKYYKDSYREILAADANVVDLHKLGPYFYAVGCKILSFQHPERADVSRSLFESYLNRVLGVIDKAQHSYVADTSTFIRRLDVSERRVFSAGQHAAREMQVWSSLHGHILQSRRKRKHSDGAPNEEDDKRAKT